MSRRFMAVLSVVVVVLSIAILLGGELNAVLRGRRRGAARTSE